MMSGYRHIVVTWPKIKPLADYLAELRAAERNNELINYRVSRLPNWPDVIGDHGWRSWPYGIERPRCYMVHSGAVRGWCQIVGACYREEGEVVGWPEGFYIVREPTFTPIEPILMEGFRGWRWYKGPHDN